MSNNEEKEQYVIRYAVIDNTTADMIDGTYYVGDQEHLRRCVTLAYSALADYNVDYNDDTLDSIDESYRNICKKIDNLEFHKACAVSFTNVMHVFQLQRVEDTYYEG